jgi:hypothetical protein
MRRPGDGLIHFCRTVDAPLALWIDEEAKQGSGKSRLEPRCDPLPASSRASARPPLAF